jgi:predicted aldo/keto reductase-like oxidoreductase
MAEEELMMTKEELYIFKTLTAKVDTARDIYLKLRDAKSNGCCHGMRIPQILEYDNKIIKAFNNYEEAQKHFEAFVQGLSS